MNKKILHLLSVLILISHFTYGQEQAFPDCVDFIPICPTSNIFELNPNGTGSVSENLGGCLFNEIGPSSWFYFEFADDTPPNVNFNFTISSFGGGNITFD